jgi:predicted dehydrogenase
MHKVAFIGTGGRSQVYADVYRDSDDIEIVGLADPNEAHRKTLIARTGLATSTPEFDDWREMLNATDRLDGLVICTPNYLHADQAVACLELGVPIALEKPLATTQEDCERIIDAERTTGGRVLLGFVLRSTPFYSKIHELVSFGVIGQIVSIQADELVGLGNTSVIYRSDWRRNSATSGGSLLEKSCHDMDILNWIMGCRPLSLHSYGSSTMFAPDQSLPDVCDDCRLAATCQYYKKPKFSSHEDRREEILHEFVREDDRCIYNIDKDTVDVQSVSIKYENGAVANFMLNYGTTGPKAGRNFHAVGTKGRIWGSLHEKTVFLHDNLTGQTTSYDASEDGSGHGGGDRKHALLLGTMMEDSGYLPDQNSLAGYLSAVMCFAADVSRTQGRSVELSYAPDGLVSIV